MSNFVVETWDNETEKVTFYSVRQESARTNEADLFFERYEKEESYVEAVQELLYFIISVIGNRYAAIDELFNRPENEVSGLPAKGRIKLGALRLHYPYFPLRIYALRITEDIVVLFGGGVKSGSSIQDSKGSLHFKWKEACSYASKITNAINDGTIIVYPRKLLLFNGSSEIYF